MTLEIHQGYGAHWASIFFFKSHNAFCKLYSTHTFICCAGWPPLPREGEGDRLVHFSHPWQDSRVKEARQLEGSSAPSICCQLFREKRSLQMTFVSLRFHELQPERPMDQLEREDLPDSLKMVNPLLHPVVPRLHNYWTKGIFSRC